MSLDDQINLVRSEIRTDGYPMSIGEWISLYESKEIDIHPEFQRFFRWSHSQKTKLIESILLGIPIPPIFVSQRKDGVWDVVDGMQRLSTIYEFAGILRDDNGNLLPQLILEKTKYLPDLENKVWDSPEESSLTIEQRLLIKRAKISVSIILRESDDKAKYELFQRLNTGGSSLTPQEVRNCILVMVNKDFFAWLRALANYQPFQDCIGLSERTLSEQYDIELALRFLIFVNLEINELDNIGDVGNFITDKMIQIAQDISTDLAQMELVFKTTFDLLSISTGDQSFARYSNEKEKFLGGFLVSAFETISYGIGYNYNKLHSKEDVVIKIKSLWNNQTYLQWSGSGMTATRRLPKLIPLGRSLFAYED